MRELLLGFMQKGNIRLAKIALGVLLILGASLAGFFLAYNQTGDLTADAEQMMRCVSPENKHTSYVCLRQEAEAMIHEFGLKPSLKSIEQISLIKGDNKTSCHNMTHALGEAGSKVLGIETAVTQCDPSCGYGCYHGAFSFTLQNNLDLVEKLPQICGRSYGFGLTACRHGAGHGLADLANRDIVRAVELCDTFEVDIGREECATGVLMEIIDNPTSAYPPFAFPPDMLSFCDMLKNPYGDVCKKTFAAYEFRRHKDVVRALKTCDRLETKLARDCAVSLGLDFYFIFEGDQKKTREACFKGGEAHADDCIEGVVTSSLVHYPKGEYAREFCAKLPLDISQNCRVFLEEKMSYLSTIHKKD